MKFTQRYRSVSKAAVLIAAAAFCGFVFTTSVPRSSRINASASGPSPSFTGGPNESNCTACHSTFAVNSGTGNVSISGLPKNYLPGQEIPVTVTVNDASGVLFGFQMTSVDTRGDKAGNYVIPAPSPVPILQVVNGFVGEQNRQYIEHTIQGITPTVAGTKSWQFAWTAPSRRVGKVTFFAAGNAANSDSSSDNDQIYTTSHSILSGSGIANFDSDGISDFSLFRPSNGTWYSLSSDGSGQQQVSFGQLGDIPVPGDYDGDGITDRAVFRPADGYWYFLLSSNGAFGGFPFGFGTDIPVQGDYDGDGMTDVAVFRQSDGIWYVLKSTGGLIASPWGFGDDLPVPGDYDGDAKTDLAVYRASEGIWYILQSSDGFAAIPFGLPTDEPVQGDYDGDGRYDVAIFRPTDGEWWINRSSEGVVGALWGSSEDIAAPADFDGDGKFDLTVFRPSIGNWYSLRSSDLDVSSAHIGIVGDIPIPSAY